MIFWEDESGLMAVIALIYISTIQGKYPVFLHPEFPSEHPLSTTTVAEGLLFMGMAGNTLCPHHPALQVLRPHVLSHVSHIQLFVTLWIAAHQTPLSIGFSRPESWSGFPFPPPEDLPTLGLKPESLTLAGRFLTASASEALRLYKEPY